MALTKVPNTLLETPGTGGSASPTAFRMSNAATAQSIPNSASQQVIFDTAEFDTDSGIDLANNQYVIPTGKGGFWHFNGAFLLAGTAGNGRIAILLTVNGTNRHVANQQTPTLEGGCSFSTALVLNAGDIVTMRAFHVDGATRNIFIPGTLYTNMSGYLVP